MSTAIPTTQPTIDGATAPPPPPAPHKGGRPRLPLHLQTRAHELARERHQRRRLIHRGTQSEAVRRHRKTRKATSPPLPFTPLTPHQKLSLLLDWHSYHPDSQATNGDGTYHHEDCEAPMTRREEAAQDVKFAALQIPPPTYRLTYEKRRPHLDE